MKLIDGILKSDLGIDVDQYWDSSPDGIIYCDEVFHQRLVHQLRSEIRDFVRAVKENLPRESDRKSALEIGLCNGGTHLIWRTLFDRVGSVENDYAKLALFSLGMTKGSTVFYGDSSKQHTVDVVSNEIGPEIDMLFIDGNHSYDSVTDDYDNYEPLVRKGGMVAFHDVCLFDDVRRFAGELEDGTYNPDMPKVEFFRIRYKQEGPGIGYYIKG